MSTATQIAAIETALETGATSITDEHGRTTNFGSRKDMLDALAVLESKLQQAATGRGFAIGGIKCSGTRG